MSVNLGRVAYVEKGKYKSDTTYESKDVVSFNGGSYVFIGDTPAANVPPTNEANWQPFIDPTAMNEKIAEMDSVKEEALTAAATANEKAQEATAAAENANTAAQRADEARESFRAELNGKASVITNDASGEIVHITDGADGMPVASLITHVEPVQEGSGDPSPDNVRPISGWDSVSVTCTGKNLFGGEALADRFESVMTVTRDDEARTISFVAKNASGKVFFTDFNPGTRYTIILYGRNGTGVTNTYIRYTDGTTGKPVFVESGADCYAVYTTNAGKSVEAFMGSYSNGTTVLYYDMCGIFEGVITEADFAEYQGKTLTAELPETVYGGTLDWTTGVLTVKSEIYTFTGEEEITVLAPSGNMYFAYYGDTNKTGVHDSQAVCSHFKIGTVTSSTTTKNVFSVWRNGTTPSWRINFRLADATITDATTCKAWLAAQYAAGTPVTVVYELVTPYTIQLTPRQMETLKGTNNIWSDAGETAVIYFADTKLYIDNKIAAIAAAIV